MKVEAVAAATASAQREVEDQENRHLCVVCAENDVNCLYTPCMHLVTCQGCDERFVHENCPQCQTTITSRVRGINLPEPVPVSF